MRAEEARTGVPAEELLARAVAAQFATAPNVNPAESELIRRLTESLPDTIWERYRALAARHHAETLTELERGELIALVRVANEWHNRRLEAGIELARQRSVPFSLIQETYSLNPVPVE